MPLFLGFGISGPVLLPDTPTPTPCPRKDTTFVLASVAVYWLWLMAAAATVVHCSAMAIWIPLRKFRMMYPPVCVMGGAGIVAAGRGEGFTLASMIVLYAFALIGLTIGLFPTRKLFTVYAHEINEGVTRERYDYPRWHIAFCIASAIIMMFAASALTR